MDSSYDIAIVGAGLAGAFAAFHLSANHRVVVLEKGPVVSGASGASGIGGASGAGGAGRALGASGASGAGGAGRASGASGVGAGLVNPFMARKANPVWRWSEALDALESALAAAGCQDLFRKSGILRPAGDERQAGWFKETFAAQPGDCSWMTAGAIRSRWPAVSADHGGLFILRAGSVHLGSLCQSLLTASSEQGAAFVETTAFVEFEESAEGVLLETESGSVKCRRLLLCTGADFADWPSLSALPLHRVKGQTITVERSARLDGDVPCLSGSGYVVPYEDHFVLGSTYHHSFKDRHPSDADTRAILEKAGRMLPALAETKVLSASTGIRVTVPGTRLPIVGPVTDSGRVWVFSGLGSKGLLMGALVGRYLPGFLDAPDSIPAELLFRR